jgi:hypothetical protein
MVENVIVLTGYILIGMLLEKLLNELKKGDNKQ